MKTCLNTNASRITIRRASPADLPAIGRLGALLVRPQRADEPDRPAPAIGRIRQRIESIVNSLKDQLQLERHLARTPEGLICRIAARILALTAAVHLNWQLRRPTRALTAYGH